MLRLLDVVIDSKYPFKEKVTFLKTCGNTGFFGEDNAESVDLVSKKIKALLSTTSERTEGLLLLQIFLDECSTDAFVQNAVSWAHLTLKAMKGSDNVEEKRLACKVFMQLIPLLPSFPSVSKQIASSVVVSLMEAVMRVSPEDEWLEDAFELLLCCMKTFPGSFGAHKVTIENFIIKHLGEWPETVLKTLSSCVSLLPWCSGGGIHGANHSSSWCTQLANMLTSLDKIIDHLYNGTYIDEEGSPLLLSSLELPSLSDSDPLLLVYCLHKNFQFLGQCVLQMLSCQHSTIVKIPFDDLLSFIWKALSVNSLEVLEKPSIDSMAIASVIPNIHCVTLSILESLICGFGKQLAPHAHTVNHVLLRSLEWTIKESSSYGMERSYSRVRVQTYQSLQVWMECLGPLSAVHEQAEVFIDHFLNDLKVEQDYVQLLSPSEHNRPHGRKRKRKQAEMIASSVSAQKKVNTLANRELCLEALIGLKSILYSCGSLLDVELHKRIHTVIVQILVDVQQQNQCGDSTTMPIPYSSTRCRQELYAVLLACVLCPHSQWPPPLQPCVAIFKRGRLDHSLKVASFCSEGLAALNMVMHPRVTVLQYLEHQVESQMLHLMGNRSSNIMVETPVPHSQHGRMEDNEEEMDFASSFSQENIIPHTIVSSNIKKDVAWRVKETGDQPRAAMMESSETISSMPGTIPLQQGTLVKQQTKPSTPPVVTQQVKGHPPPQPLTTQPVGTATQGPAAVEQPQKAHHHSQHHPHQGKASLMQRGPAAVARATEEVVLLSEEESAEDNHMEEGMDEEEEDEEEEEEEEGEDYPEEEEDGEYEAHTLKEDAYYRDKSPSLVLTGGRSTEDSSSTGVAVAVSSIVGNLVSEAVSNNSHTRGLVPVQKARRTGVLARTEHSSEMEEYEMDGHHVEEDEEGVYEGEDIYEDEDEEGEEEEVDGAEVEGGEGDELLQGECEDDVEEVHDVEDQESGDNSQQYQVIQKWSEEPDQELQDGEAVLISDGYVQSDADPAPTEDDQNQEQEEITTLQPLQFHPTTTEHSNEEMVVEQYEQEPQIVSTTTLQISPEKHSSEFDLVDGEDPSKSHEPSGNDSDVIELSDSPLKESVANRENRTEDMPALETLVQNNDGTANDSADVQEADSVGEENAEASRIQETDDAKMSGEQTAPSPNGTLSNETHSVANDMQMIVEEIHSPNNEHSNQVTENSVNDTNHSAAETTNCSPVGAADEENKTVSGSSSETREKNKNVRHTVPDSPEEPTAKKMCMRIREKEESEPEEESPPVHVMLQTFVCRERETE